jgi:predicted dehydrogenase
MVNIGIVGCGGISAFTHIPQLISMSENIKIKYLCDTNLNRANRIKERYFLSNAHCTDKPDTVFNDDSVSAVIVATWPTNILKLSIDSIKKNKHVLIQKPIIGDEQNFKLLYDEAKMRNVSVLALPHIDNIKPFNEIRNYIKYGELGKINYARIRTTIPGPSDYYCDVINFFQEARDSNPYRLKEYAQGRGALSDMGPYALSAFHFLFGEGRLISCVQTPEISDEFSLLTLSSEAIPICTIEIGWKQIKGIEICSIYGENGTVTMKTDGSIEILKRNGNIEYFCSDLSNQSSVMLPVSPFDAQNEWINSIETSNFGKLHHTIIRANWVTKIITEAYKSK